MSDCFKTDSLDTSSSFSYLHEAQKTDNLNFCKWGRICRWQMLSRQKRGMVDQTYFELVYSPQTMGRSIRGNLRPPWDFLLFTVDMKPAAYQRYWVNDVAMCLYGTLVLRWAKMWKLLSWEQVGCKISLIDSARLWHVNCSEMVASMDSL